MLSYIADSVDVTNFFTTFKGRFKGEAYDRAVPPTKRFLNAATFRGFETFISKTIMERVLNG